LGLMPVKPMILSTPEIEVPVKAVLFSFSPAFVVMRQGREMHANQKLATTHESI